MKLKLNRVYEVTSIGFCNGCVFKPIKRNFTNKVIDHGLLLKVLKVGHRCLFKEKVEKDNWCGCETKMGGLKEIPGLKAVVNGWE